MSDNLGRQLDYFHYRIHGHAELLKQQSEINRANTDFILSHEKDLKSIKADVNSMPGKLKEGIEALRKESKQQ